MSAVTVYDAGWADAITARIRNAGEQFGALLLEAHDGRAWKLKGYKSWEAYAAAEFGFARAKSYRLLTTERVNQKRIASGAPPLSQTAALKVSQSETSATDFTIDSGRVPPRYGPVPKPGGGKRRGMRDPGDRPRLIAEEMERYVEDSEGDAIDYIPDEMRRRMRRPFERVREAADTMLERLARPLPVRSDEAESW